MAMKTGAAVTVRAFAKINLTLRVLGTRDDGFHELRTAFQSLALHDTLIFTTTDRGFEIECTDATIPVDRSNLIWKAADLLAKKAAPRRRLLPGLRVKLIKRIPAQAGLGGGSSDAAATLRALNALFGLAPTADELDVVARTLGADVSFFLHGGAALGVERGDLLFPLADASPAWVVVARPPFGVSTADAYRWWDEASRRRRPRDARPSTPNIGFGRLPASEMRNDLEPPVVARYPEIARLVRLLRQSGARYAAMSGSGSAVFGLFDEKPGAEAAAARCIVRGAAALVTRTLPRASFGRLSEPTGL